MRKSKEQIEILANEFRKEPVWSSRKMARLASELNLKVSQVYKWNWDRRMAQDLSL